MQLKKNQVNNNISLTLKEKTTISNPVYLFRFQSDQTKEDYFCICQDVAPLSQQNRVNIFNITEGISDQLNSKLILGLQGRYHYFIYEQSSTTNLNPIGLDIVQRGIMVLKGTQASKYVSYETDVKYKVYE